MTKYIQTAMASETESETSSPNLNQTPVNPHHVFPENTTIPIAGHKLTSHNYNQWSHSVMIFVCGKGKEEYLTGTALEPDEKSPGYRTWKVENNMVMSWLLNSMTNETGENFMYYKTAKEIWDAVRETYSNKDNTSAIFEIKGILQDLKQGESSVTDYFNMLIRYWQQLDMLEDVTWKCPDDGKQYKQIQEKERIYKFLLGLNRDLDEVRGRILSTKPLPSVREVFSEVRREEIRRKVMLGVTTNQPITDGSALIVRGPHSNTSKASQPSTHAFQKKSNRPWCEHCKRTGHTKETCWKLNGKPIDWKPSPRITQDSKGNVATSESQMSLSNPFNKEQLGALQKMLNTTIQNALSSVGTSTATMAQGNSLTTLGAEVQNIKSWIVDSGASDHMTGDITQLENYKSCSAGTMVRIADGSSSAVAGIGSVFISDDIRLDSVLFVPKLDFNLLSISKFTKDMNCIAKLTENTCEFQDLISGRTIGNAELSGGLYLLRANGLRSKGRNISCVVSSRNKDSAIMLWHYRLGHPNFVYLKKLFPSLFNKRFFEFTM